VPPNRISTDPAAIAIAGASRRITRSHRPLIRRTCFTRFQKSVRPRSSYTRYTNTIPVTPGPVSPNNSNTRPAALSKRTPSAIAANQHPHVMAKVTPKNIQGFPAETDVLPIVGEAVISTTFTYRSKHFVIVVNQSRKRLLNGPLYRCCPSSSTHALFCRRLTTVSDALTVRFRQINREMDAVWRYGIAQTASVDVSRSCQNSTLLIRTYPPHREWSAQRLNTSSPRLGSTV